jgi:hypothetical protein
VGGDKGEGETISLTPTLTLPIKAKDKKHLFAFEKRSQGWHPWVPILMPCGSPNGCEADGWGVLPAQPEPHPDACEQTHVPVVGKIA